MSSTYCSGVVDNGDIILINENEVEIRCTSSEVGIENIELVSKASASSTATTNKTKYCQIARSAWKNDPPLKDWIIFNNDKVVACKFCNILISSKYSTLKTHANSQKHLKVAAPFSIGKQTVIPFKRPNTKLIEEVHAGVARTALFIAKH